VLVTDASRKFAEEPNSRLKQRFQSHWFSRHADKRGLILLRDVFGRREEHFVHRPIVPGKVCDKALDRPLCESIGFVHLRDIKEVSWVLAIKGGDNLAPIEFLNRKRGHG